MARPTSGHITRTCRSIRWASRSRSAGSRIITTAAPYQPGKGDQGPGAPYNAAAKFYTVYSGDTAKDHDLRISHVAIDRKHTTAEDPATYFPLTALRQSAAAGRIGSVAPRFHGLPTNRSHRVTLEVDCPEIVARCKADGVDAAILVPNCPVCHQSVSLAARMLEENGISTVVMGCAKDIVEYVGVPRFLFSDFPLGNAAGRPKDRASQAFTLDLASERARDRRLPRGRPSNRRWSGVPAQTGSSITATSNASRRRRSSGGARISTSKKRGQGPARGRRCRFEGDQGRGRPQGGLGRVLKNDQLCPV